MPEFRDSYRPSAPKLTKDSLRETIRDNIGRVVGEEDDIQNALVVRDKRENGFDKVTLINENGNETAPLGYGVCRHCGSDFDDAVRICPTCHALLKIP